MLHLHEWNNIQIRLLIKTRIKKVSLKKPKKKSISYSSSEFLCLIWKLSYLNVKSTNLTWSKFLLSKYIIKSLEKFNLE